jgi:serine phosphatase RsbU (regulator of sigma subunit)
MSEPEYFIQVRDHAGRVFDVRVERLPFTIGRGPENDLVLAEPSVSKRHAYLHRHGGQLAVVDDHSRNGIVINHEKEKIPAGLPRPLQVNDTLRVGMNWLKVGERLEPRIPAQAPGSGTILFFPSSEAWDPIKSIHTGFPGEASRPPDARREIQWQAKVSRILLAATLSESYETLFNLLEEEVAFDRCYLILFAEGSTERVKVEASRVHGHGDRGVFVSRSLLQRMADSRQAVMVTSDDTRFEPTQSFIQSGAVVALSIPLIVGGRVSGALYLDSQSRSRSLSADDFQSIGPLAGLIALKIENFRLAREQVAAEMLTRELDLAKSIQDSLFPQEPIVVPGYSIEGCSAPCYQIGGDYFDFIPQRNSRWIIVIGDVSGKGLSSAIYMASARAALRAHAQAGGELEDLMSRLEAHIQATFRSDHFLTLLLGVLDPASHSLIYANAGHLPALGIGDEGLFELEASDPALNLMPWGAFRRHERRIAPGDLVLFYTDGVIEAENSRGEQFGSERLKSCLLRNRDKDLHSIRREILAETESFAGETGPGDDRTIILLRRERT